MKLNHSIKFSILTSCAWNLSAASFHSSTSHRHGRSTSLVDARHHHYYHHGGRCRANRIFERVLTEPSALIGMGIVKIELAFFKLNQDPTTMQRSTTVQQARWPSCTALCPSSMVAILAISFAFLHFFYNCIAQHLHLYKREVINLIIYKLHFSLSLSLAYIHIPFPLSRAHMNVKPYLHSVDPCWMLYDIAEPTWRYLSVLMQPPVMCRLLNRCLWLILRKSSGAGSGKACKKAPFAILCL